MNFEGKLVKKKIRGATIRDVARKADLSIGTISRYLNGYILREKNRSRIEAAIEELGFKENIIAKGLKNNRTMTVGVVIDNLTDIFMTTVVTSIEQWLEKKRYSIILCDYQGDNSKLDQKLKFLKTRSIDGLILFPYGKHHTILNEYLKDSIPVILINDDLEELKTDTVRVDNRMAAQKAIRYLYGAGHRKIAIIRGREGSYTSDERLAGYLDAHRELKLPINDKYILQGQYTDMGGYDAMNTIIDENLGVTAVFSCSYAMTMGALLVVNEKNIKIPESLSFISFDNFRMFDMVKPRLSVIEQPLWSMGETAASLLYRRIHGDYDDFPRKDELHTSFIERESVLFMKHSFL